jgi:hypothetical protein
MTNSEKPMTREITISLEEDLIEAATRRARAQQTTIDELFRRWLADYVRTQDALKAFDALTEELSGKVRIGRKLPRESMNEC